MRRGGLSLAWLALLLLTLCGCGGQSGVGAAGDPAPRLTSAPTTSLKLLVIGGTSGIGLETVKLALDRGHRVTALARRPERMTLRHEHLETVAGDVLDPASMLSSVPGHDAVVIAIGMELTREPVTLFSAGTANVLAAMRNSGTRRLIAVTGIGAGDTRGHGGFFYEWVLTPLGLKTIYADKDRQEALIRQAGDRGDIDWTVVRPGFLTDEPARMRYRVVSDVSGLTCGEITRADVGHFIIAAIESKNYLSQTPLLSE